MNRPEISLLIPCHNASAYLSRLLETVRAQTQPFAEIICYDDGSDDDTVAEAQRLGLRIIIGEKNHGPAFARNRLAEAAKYPWIHFHDADDLLTPYYVEKVSSHLGDDIDVLVCDMDWVDETTRQLVLPWRYDSAALSRDAVSANLCNPIGVIACTFRRERLLQIGGFNQEFRTWEDADLQIRLAAAGARYRALPVVLVIGLRHDRGISSVRDGNLNLEDRTRLLEGYVHTLDRRYHHAVASAAEKHAGWLLAFNQQPDLANRCLAICRKLRWRVPSTHHPLLRLARILFPSRWLLKQQAAHRWHKKSSGLT